LTNNYNAEFGTGAGGQFNTITKTGTNTFNGNLFVYADNQNLNAASTFEERDLRSGDLTELPRSRNARYGATLGGPIVRNKLFFFVAGQRQNFSEESGSALFLAPTPGGLNQIAALPGVSQFSVNLLRNNLQLASDADTAINVLGTPIPFGEVSLNIPSSLGENLLQINVDHLPNDKNQFRYRFFLDRTGAVQAGNGSLGFNNNFSFDAKRFSATWVRTFSANVVNDFRVSYRSAVDNFPLVNSGLENFPNITLLDDTGISIGPNGNLPQGTPVDNNYQIFNTVNYIRGNHSFKFGGEYRNLIFTSAFLPRARGDYFYSSFDQFIQDLRPDIPGLDIRGVGYAAFLRQYAERLFLRSGRLQSYAEPDAQPRLAL
jgi:hypothetical protein